MHREKIRELLHAQPFRPFRIQMADGRHFDVTHPEFMLLPSTGRFAMLWRPNGTPIGVTDQIYLPLITSLGTPTRPSRRRRTRRS